MDSVKEEAEEGDEDESDDDEEAPEAGDSSEGPWVLVASASGLGKRVPVTQFRLQRRAGLGLRAIKFRRDGDVLVGLTVMGPGEELLLVSERGVIVRMQADAIPQQSRAATGVRYLGRRQRRRFNFPLRPMCWCSVPGRRDWRSPVSWSLLVCG